MLREQLNVQKSIQIYKQILIIYGFRFQQNLGYPRLLNKFLTHTNCTFLTRNNFLRTKWHGWITTASLFVNIIYHIHLVRADTVQENNIYNIYNDESLVPIFHLFEDQSTDLPCKSIDWFRYQWNIGTKMSQLCDHELIHTNSQAI